jgi:hypothetical protein
MRVIAHPNTIEQTEAIKAFMKALKIKFEISKNNETEDYLDELENSFTQVKKMQEGKIEKQQLNDFLNEL